VRLAPQSDTEREQISAAGLDLRRILTCDELVAGNQIFFAATGIADGPLLDGVRYQGQYAQTHSIILRCETGTRRILHAEHMIEPS
jgi:fructose-1,6-bisphosphatase II